MTGDSVAVLVLDPVVVADRHQPTSRLKRGGSPSGAELALVLTPFSRLSRRPMRRLVSARSSWREHDQESRIRAFCASNSASVSTPCSLSWASSLSWAIVSPMSVAGAAGAGAVGAGWYCGAACCCSCSAQRPAWRRDTRFDTAVAVPATTAVRATPRSSPGIYSSFPRDDTGLKPRTSIQPAGSPVRTQQRPPPLRELA
jgi:hypothetical protein